MEVIKTTKGITITSDNSLLEDLYGTSPKLSSELEELHEIVITGEKSGIKRLQKLIKQHPKNPMLKNFLSGLYENIGEMKKAYETDELISKAHPSFLFGKVNAAFRKCEEENYEEMPKLLGDNFDIQELYPDRDIFHVNEVLAIKNAAVHYFCATSEFEKAEIQLDLMEKIDSDSNEYKMALSWVSIHKVEDDTSWILNSYLTVEVEPSKATTSTIAPTFNHPEIEWLYQNDIRLPEEKIHKILSLPRESLIQDLELVLTDAVDRYSYFLHKYNKEYADEEFSFVTHSLFFLAELESKESLKPILNFLSEGEALLDMYLGEFLTETTWEVFVKLMKNDPGNETFNLLEKFVLKPGVYNYSKSAIGNALDELAYHYPEQRQIVLQWFEDVFIAFLGVRPEENIVDSECTAFLVSNVVDIGGVELLQLIEKLFEKNYVFQGVCGDYSSIKKDIIIKTGFHYDEKSLIDRYKHILDTWAGYNDDKDFYPPQNYDNEHFHTQLQAPIVKGKKIGRNEPCPCGSGKKYKKCCL